MVMLMHECWEDFTYITRHVLQCACGPSSIVLHVQMIPCPLVDFGEGCRHARPLSAQFFSFSCSFWEKTSQIIGYLDLCVILEIGLLNRSVTFCFEVGDFNRLGNPKSATDATLTDNSMYLIVNPRSHKCQGQGNFTDLSNFKYKCKCNSLCCMAHII